MTVSSNPSRSRTEYQRAWRAANRERLLEAKRQYHKDHREAELARMKARYAEKKPEYQKQSKAWSAANPAKEKARLQERYQTNAETERRLRREHYVKNKSTYVARAKHRKILLINRVPPWADTQAIKAVYAQAEEMRALGLDVHVDHI